MQRAQIVALEAADERSRQQRAVAVARAAEREEAAAEAASERARLAEAERLALCSMCQWDHTHSYFSRWAECNPGPPGCLPTAFHEEARKGTPRWGPTEAPC